MHGSIRTQRFYRKYYAKKRKGDIVGFMVDLDIFKRFIPV